MTLLVIADDDGVAQNVPTVKADVLISCGDLWDDTIMRCAFRASCAHVLAVKGNHDSSFPFPEPIVDMHLRTCELHGVRFGGFGGCWRYKPRGNHLFDQSDVAAALRDFPPVDVFVAHNSPRLTHDQEDEVHYGFTAFVDYIERAKPRLFLHGHQHVHGETRLGVTRVIGTFGHRYLAFS